MDLDKMLAGLWHGTLPNVGNVRKMCEQLKYILMHESNVLELRSPVTVVGDIHGQFYDLLELFRVGGPLPHVNYLFMGNYVDRGDHGVETMLLLACLKLKYRNRLHLLRGNHESRHVTQIHGFYDECIRKYGSATIWQELTDLFDCLPLSATIDKGENKGIFCVHAGLSAELSTLDNVRVLDRFREVPVKGVITDLLWSDPDLESTGVKASERGVGQLFGLDVVTRFIQNNGLKQIVRGHQLVMEGYQELYAGKLNTVWSAPNFLGNVGNVGAVLEVFDDKQSQRFNVFAAAPQSERDTDCLDECSKAVMKASFTSSWATKAEQPKRRLASGLSFRSEV